MIVVFGAGGFVGSYLLPQLTAEGHDVVASDINENVQVHYRKQGVRFERIDIRRNDDFDMLPANDVDAVVHLACVQPANVSEAKYDPRQYISVNVLGTLNILEYCRRAGIPRIIYACSHRNTQGLWAAKAGERIRESEGRGLKLTGDYAMFSISESAATDCVEHYSATHGIDGVVFRLPPVYGYGPYLEIFKDGKPMKTGFQIFIENAMASRPLEVWGDAERGRDIVYVKDVVSAIELALRTPEAAGLYNIASGRGLSLREQAETIVRTFSPAGNPSRITYRPEQPNLIESYVYDIEKARSTFGWQPRYSFEDMLVDYRKEMSSGRFDFLIDGRHRLMEQASRD